MHLFRWLSLHACINLNKSIWILLFAESWRTIHLYLKPDKVCVIWAICNKENLKIPLSWSTKFTVFCFVLPLLLCVNVFGVFVFFTLIRKEIHIPKMYTITLFSVNQLVTFTFSQLNDLTTCKWNQYVIHCPTNNLVNQAIWHSLSAFWL